ELNDDLSPTGRSFKSEIRDDKGTFSLDNITLASDYVQLSVNGYYFNEITGNLSSSQITLNAIADISHNKQINVNVLSHLEEKRVRSLIKNKKVNFAAAKEQAIREIYDVFFVKGNPTSNSEAISLTKDGNDANILLGISAALLSLSQSDNAQLTQLLSILSTDIEDNGKVEETWKEAIQMGLASLNPESLSENVKYRYADLGTTISDFTLEEVFTVTLEGDPDIVENPYYWDIEEALN